MIYIMADISQIKLNNTTYNIKDSTARQDIDSLSTDVSTNFVKKSGGTMTGTLYLQPETGEGGQIEFKSASNDTTHGMFYIDNYYGTLRIVPRNSTDGTTDTNGTIFLINPFSKTFGAGYTYSGSLNNSSQITNALGYIPVNKDGDTLTGILKVKAGQYADDAKECGLNMNNSNIIGLNAIYTADAADNASEGIHFQRDATHYDTLWVSAGAINFVPNRELGTATSAANSQRVGRFTSTPTDNNMVLSDGTTGGLKTISLASLVTSNYITTTLGYIPLNKDGDTMTGHLTINAWNPIIYEKYTGIGIGESTTSTLWTGGINMQDKNGTSFGYMETQYTATKGCNIRMLSRNRCLNANNEYVNNDNILILYSYADGTQGVALSANAKNAWRKELGIGDGTGAFPLTIAQGGSGQTSVTTNTRAVSTTTCASGTITYKKWGPIVHAYVSSAIKLKNNLTAANIYIGTVPEGFRPLANNPYLGGHDAYPSTVWIKPSDGAITFCKPSTTASWSAATSIFFTATYFAS